jgi:heat shock protein 5
VHSRLSLGLADAACVGGSDFSETLMHAKFEELNMDLFRETMKPLNKC